MSVRPRPRSYSPTGVTITLTAPASRSASATGPAVSALTRAIMFPPRPPPESFAPPAPRSAGAGGAKLSGGGRGGNMIALVSAETAGPVAEALREAGAVRVIVTPVGEYERGRGRTLIHQPG